MTQLTVNEVLAKVLDQESLNCAELSHIDLEGASLNHGKFSEAYLRAANLMGASCDGTDFSGATLVLALLSGASLEKASLENAQLTQARLNRGLFRELYAPHAKFRGTELNESDP